MKKSPVLANKKGLKESTVYYLIMAPFMILFFVFGILPILASMVLSFFDYDMVSTPIFIGFDNYIRMFTGDQAFFNVVGTTLKLMYLIVTGNSKYSLRSK